MSFISRPGAALRSSLTRATAVRFSSTSSRLPSEDNSEERSSSSQTPSSSTSSQALPQIPRSAQIFPMNPSPTPPWMKEPLPIYHINYPHPAFPILKGKDKLNSFEGTGMMQIRRRLSAITGMSGDEIASLKRAKVSLQPVSHMTKKGRMRSFLAYALTGHPEKGLVGIGRGRGVEPEKAMNAAFYEAAMNMDAVNRYEDRTLWGQGKELVTKYGSSKVSLRARPPGHGLKVPLAVHRVLTCCGIRDASAQLDGSTHPVLAAKAVIQLLHGGANPPHFGTGTSGKGRRDNKGRSMRSQEDIQRQRGRYGVDIGLRV